MKKNLHKSLIMSILVLLGLVSLLTGTSPAAEKKRYFLEKVSSRKTNSVKVAQKSEEKAKPEKQADKNKVKASGKKEAPASNEKGKAKTPVKAGDKAAKQETKNNPPGETPKKNESSGEKSNLEKSTPESAKSTEEQGAPAKSPSGEKEATPEMNSAPSPAAGEEKNPAPPESVEVIPQDGPAPLKLNLTRALEIASENHPDIKIARAKVQSAEGSYIQTKSTSNFKFDFDGSYTRIDPVSEITMNMGGSPTKIKMGSENNFSGSVTLRKIITTFGNLENTIAASGFNLKAAAENYESIFQDIMLLTKERYFHLLLSYGQVEVARDNVNIVRRQLKIANDMYDAGTLPRYDVLRNQLFLSQARQALITAEKNRDLDQAQLLETLALSLEIPVELKVKRDVDYLDINLGKAQEAAMTNRPEIKSLVFSLEAATRLLHAALNNRNPMLSFQSVLENQTISGLSSEPTTWTTSLVLNIPLSDGGETYGKIKSAKASVKELEETLDKTRRLIKLEVKKAYLTIKEVEAKIDAARQDTATALENYNIALARYENGLSTGVELDDARKSLNEARIQYINLLFQYHIEVARLEKATATTWKGVTAK